MFSQTRFLSASDSLFIVTYYSDCNNRLSYLPEHHHYQVAAENRSKCSESTRKEHVRWEQREFVFNVKRLHTEKQQNLYSP